jgi:predicted esterase YcpF (UPF0227 family)
MRRPVIYVHGYGSNGQTQTAVNMRPILAQFLNFDLVSPTYNGSDPLKALAELEACVEQLRDQSPIIMGTSLGGFFANVLARKLDLPAVLVNPVRHPSKSLHKYGEGPEVLAGYQHLEAYEESLPHHPFRFVVLGAKDDVVDPHTNGALLTDNAQIVWLDMGHRLEPDFYSAVTGLLQDFTKQPGQSS